MSIKVQISGKAACLFLLFFVFSQLLHAQKKSYKDCILAYQKNYIATNEVVDKPDKKYIHFYEIDKSYCVNATFENINDQEGFNMNTSSGKRSKYFKYGVLTFRLQDSLLHLYVYQSEVLMKRKKLKEYLFVPFGDATSGFESYGGGRYMEFYIPEIKNSLLKLDFNKAYNPYCTYNVGYDCPIPPIENLLPIPIRAGEKNYSKKMH